MALIQASYILTKVLELIIIRKWTHKQNNGVPCNIVTKAIESPRTISHNTGNSLNIEWQVAKNAYTLFIASYDVFKCTMFLTLTRKSSKKIHVDSCYKTEEVAISQAVTSHYQLHDAYNPMIGLWCFVLFFVLLWCVCGAENQAKVLQPRALCIRGTQSSTTLDISSLTLSKPLLSEYFFYL